MSGNTQQSKRASFFIFSLNQNQNLFHSNMSSSLTFVNDAFPHDEEEEKHLFTQPESEAEAVDLTVELDPPKRKATTPGKTTKKKKQRCDISDANLDAQLKQVSTKNVNDFLLHANDSLLDVATEDNKTKRVTKYFTMPVIGKKSSVWWEVLEPSRTGTYVEYPYLE